MVDEELKKLTNALIKQRRPEVKEEDLDLHHGSAYYWGPENFSQSADWISRTLEILREPDRFHNRDVFINFFGIVDDGELVCFLKGKTTSLFKTLGIKNADVSKFIASNKNKENREYLARAWEAKNIAELIWKDFTEDEKFLLRFVRHRHCHVTLSDFAVKFDKHGDDLKIRTANWKRLVSLSKTTTAAELRKTLIEKLLPHRDALMRIKALIAPAPGGRLLPE